MGPRDLNARFARLLSACNNSSSSRRDVCATSGECARARRRFYRAQLVAHKLRANESV